MSWLAPVSGFETALGLDFFCRWEALLTVVYLTAAFLQTAMQNLPTEVLESILLWCATCGHPFSVASIAQTCRQLRALVYDAKDRHLW